MIIDGKKLAAEIQDEVKTALSHFNGRPPCLAVILVGTDPASEIYVSRKAAACVAVGIRSIKREFPSAITEKELLEEIETLNQDPGVDGILVQLPLPKHISPVVITEAIHPDKDVDGFHPYNVGQVLIGLESGFAPCTPLGVMRLFDKCSIQLAGKHIVVIGRSSIVGKPMAAMLMQNHPQGPASVNVLHRHSTQVEAFCRMADIIIVAVGIPGYITADMVKEGAVVIDIGINKIDNPQKKRGYQIVGDVDFDNVKEKASFITPVPGGVGPLTIAVLLENTLKSYRMHHFNKSDV